MANPAQRSFAAGELSPAMYARADLQRYADGLKALRNATVLRTGGVQSRPGTQYLGTTKSSGVARLIEAVFDTDAAYVLEFGNLYVRFWKSGALVTATVTGAWANTTAYTAGVVVSYSGTNYVCLVAHTSVEATDRPSTGSSWQTKWYALTGTTYELPTPYTTAQLFDLQVAAQYNVLYIVHPDHEPATLTRTSNNVWDLADIDFATESGVLVAPGISLDPDEPGAAGVSWMATTADYDGAVLVSESEPSAAAYTAIAMGSEATVNVALAAANKVIQFDTFPTGGYLARIYRNSTGSGWRFLAAHDPVSGDFTDDGSISETANTEPPAAGSTATFDAAGSYPSVVGAYQQRLLLGGTDDGPDVIFASKTAEPTDFGTSNPIEDSDSLSWRQVGPRLHRVRHLVEAARTLWSLSDVGETMVQGAEDSLLVPGAPNPRQYSANGAASTPEPLIANDSVLYVQARGGIVRDLFPVQLGGFAGSDLTLQSAHLVDGYTIADWTYQQTPDSVIWAVRSDGELLSLTYVRELGVLGWARHDTDGLFKSVATVPESKRDAVYAVVERTINSSTVRYVERFYDRLADDPILMDAAVEAT